MKSNSNKIFFSSVLIVLLSISQAFAQESSCTNGIDDDGDGFIDCYDGDCAGGPSCADFFYGNPIVCKDEPTDNPTFAMKLQWGSDDRSADSHATPAIGDLDNDNLPEVVVINRLDERLFILNGEDGTTAFTYDLGYQPENGIVLANLDGGDCANIYVSRDNSSTITALDCEANLLWETNASDRVGIMGIADFNGDGNAELYYKTEIMDAANGNILVPGTGDNWVQNYAHSAMAVDILPDGDCADCSGLELITGNQIWSINIATGTRTLERDLNDLFAAEIPVNNNRYYTKYFNTTQNRTAISVADYNQDGHVDVLMPGAYGSSNSSQTTIFLWDVLNGTYLVYDGGVNHNKGTGRLNVSDIDGDGFMNTTYVSDQILYALDENLDVLWTKGIDEGSSGFTGTTVFDFDGDGAAETIYRSESYLYIIDGVDGSTRTTIPCVSRTQEEYPIVADVDNDGSSELCVPCYTNNNTPFSPYGNTRFSQIRIYEADGGEIWQPSRRVWNQHGYYNVNVNDDLTIPAQQQDHAAIFGNVDCVTGAPLQNQALNGFLNQSTFLEADGCPSYVSPDITMAGNISATPSLCPLSTFNVTFDIENTGDTDIYGSLPVTFYEGDPETPGALKLNTVAVDFSSGLLQGETSTVNLTVEGPGGDFDLYISLNNNGQAPPISLAGGGFPECDFGNNIGNISVTYTPFTLTVNKLEDNRRCDLTKPDNGEAEAYFEGTLGGDYETIWVEDFFGLPNGDRSDTGPTAWTSSRGSFNPRNWGVGTKSGNKVYRTNKTGQNNEVSEVTWLSEVIDISGHTDVDLSLQMLTNNTLEESGRGRDYMRAFYILDGGPEVEFDVNGELYGSFLYAVAEQQDLNGNDVQIKVTFHTTGNGEYQYLDNVQVSGVSLPVNQIFTDADGFEFNWYNAGDYSAPVASGSLNTGMASGSYDVIGFFPGGNCYSDTVNVVINDSVPTFNVHVYEVAPYTDCADPDGELSAFVYTQTDGSGDPLDTLTTGYTFSWVLSTEGITPVGTSPDLTNLTSESYTVRVEQLITGCTSSASGAPASSLIIPVDPTVSKVDISACTGPGVTGSASADVGGSTAGLTFEWFYQSVDATPDYTGANVSGLLEGNYFVRAVDNGSSCPSSLVPFEIIDTSADPSPVAVQVQPDNSCEVSNGIATADGDGAGTTAGYTFEWFVGNTTSGAAQLPAALAGSSISADGATASGLANGLYTVRASIAGCESTDTVRIEDTEVVPAYNIVTQVDAGNALRVLDKAIVRMPQLISGSSEFTMSYWVEISTNNYINDHRIFSSGGKNESQMMLWTSDEFGISFVIKGDGDSGVGKINTFYKPTGWVQLTGTWNELSGEMKLYANGVKIGETYYIGDDPDPTVLEGVIDNGPDMYIAGDGNFGVNKFEGRIDEVKIYDRALDETEILSELCDPVGGSTTGLLAHYNFNAIGLATAQGSSVPDVSGNGNDGTLTKPGVGSPGSWTYVESGIQCPLVGMVNNTSCDPANPNGIIDLTDAVDPIGASYEYTVYEGNEVDTDTIFYVNTTGIFTGLADGFYTVVTQDQVSLCETDPLTLSIATLPEQPSIVTSVTDNAGCTIGSGEILVTSTSPSSEPSDYTYELYDGWTYSTLLRTETVTNGSTGFNFTGLTTGAYRIRVINNDILCEDYTDEFVDDISVDPSWNHPSTIENANTACGSTPNGFASVAPIGNLADFTFEWYTGELVDPDSLMAGETQEFIDTLVAKKYTVVATSLITGCPTPPKTVTIPFSPVFPNVIIVEVQPQNSCDIGDGILRAYVDEPDPSDCIECNEVDDYSFEWFLGNDTSTPLIEATDPGNNSNPTFVDSSQVEGLTGGFEYTVLVTNNLTGCTSEATLPLTYDPQSPTIDAANSKVVANTLCGAMGNGSIVAAVDFVGETVNGAVNDQPWDIISDCNTETYLDSNILPDGSIELTRDANNQSGKAYLGDSVDFSKPTRIDFWMYLGDKDATGADGITFIFHRDPDGKDALGRYGCNLGIGDESCSGGTEDAILPSVAVEFDTWNNFSPTKDPAYDHTAFVINGEMDLPQGDVGVFYNANQPRIVNGQDDVEAADAELRVTITIVPNIDGTQTFTVYVEDEIRLQRTQDFINDLFSGNPKTIGGFTAATGGSTNQQYVRLDPYFGAYDFDWYAGSTVDPANLIAGADKPYLCDLLGGDYTMVVTYNETGCTSSPPNTFTVPNNTDTATVSFSGVSNTVCDPALALSGTFTGSLTANITQDPADYDFAWFEGSAPTVDTLATTQAITDIPGGDYTVVVQSLAGGCITIRDTTLVDVTVDPAIVNTTTDVTVQNVTSCEGSATYPNGSITVNTVGIGSGGPYGFWYYYGADTTTGTFLTDASDIFTQTSTPGTASVNVSGNGTATLTGLSAGDYTIIVIDSVSGCTSVEANVSIIDVPTIPNLASAPSPNTVCDPSLAASGAYDGEILISTTDGTNAATDYTYAWYEGTGTTTPVTLWTINQNILSEAPDGNYTVVATSNSTGCDTTIYRAIGDATVDPAITSTSFTNVTSCEGGPTYPNGTITVSGITGSGTYGFMYWYGADTTTGTLLTDGTDIFTQTPATGTSTVPVSGNGTATLTGLAAGDYTIIVIDSASGCTSIEANETIINVPTIPNLNQAIIDNTVCDSVLVGDYNGSVTISTIDATNAVTDYSYAWYDGTGVGPVTSYTATDNILSDAPDGNYTVVATSLITGCDTTIYATIGDATVDPVLGTINVTDMSVCDGAVVYPNGAIEVNESAVTNGNASDDYSYEFYWGSSVDATKLLSDGEDIVNRKTGGTGGVPLDITDNIISNLDTGFYTIVLIDNVTGCIANEVTVEIDIVINPMIIPGSVTHLTSCATPNGEITVTPTMSPASEPTGGYSYVWYYGSGTTNPLDGTSDLTDPSALSGETTATVSGLEVGTYTVLVTNNDTECTETAEFDVEDQTVIPVIAAGSIVTQPNVNCVGTPTGSVDATSAVTPAISGTVTYTFELLDMASPANVLATEDMGTGADGIFMDRAPGNYRIRATINQTGCISTIIPLSVGETLTPPNLAGTVSSNETSCVAPNGELSFSTTSGTPPLNWNVDIFRGIGTGGQNVYSETNSALSSWVSPDTLSDGTYTIRLINNSTGCDSLIQQTIIENFDTPALNTADVVRTNDTYCTSDNGTITITADDSNIANNAGANPIFRLYSGSTPTGVPLDQVQLGSNSHTFSNRSPGTYTVTILKDESGCESNGITRTITNAPISFTPGIDVYSNQSSCLISNPNGELHAELTAAGAGAPATLAGYDFEWYRGPNTNSSNRILTGGIIPTASVSASGEIVSGLPAGTYRLKMIDPISGCFYTVDASIIIFTQNPAILGGGPTASPSDQCFPSNGEISVTVDDGGSTQPYDGAGGYTFELYDGTIGAGESPIQTENVTTVTGARDEATWIFTGLEPGDYTVQIIDNNTSCLVTSTLQTILYNGQFLTYDENNIFKDPLSPGSCFDQDGILDFLNAVSGASSITGPVTIHWYIGTDTTNKANLLNNAISGVAFSSVIYDPGGANVTIDSARIENLPAISYTGVIEYANGCIEVFNTDLSTTDAPTLTLNNAVDPTRCAAVYDGSFDIVLDPTAADSPDEFNYFVFEGNQTIAPHSPAGSPGPYNPDLTTYGPVVTNGTFTSSALDNPETISVNNLDSGTYTVAIEINDADRCIVAVETITLAAPPEPTITMTLTQNNTTCDITTGLFYDGEITVNGGGPTFDFQWYRDGDNDGDFDDGGADGQILLADGGNGIPGFNVSGSSTTNTTSTVSGIGPGWYRVIGINTTTSCPDILDIEIFDEPVDINVGNTAGVDFNIAPIDDCSTTGSYEILRVLEDGSPNASVAADYTLTWTRLSDNADVTPAGEVSSSTLTEDDYEILLVNDASGCSTIASFSINDITEDPVIVLSVITDNSICTGGPLNPNGAITIQVENATGVVQDPSVGYLIQWYKGSVSGTTRVPQDLETTASSAAGAGNTWVLDGISGGAYFVRVTDIATPNNTCFTDANSIIIQDNPTEVTIQTSASDVDIDHQVNCDLLAATDGRIEILRVLEDGVEANLIGSYNFSWYISDMTTALDIVSVPTVNFPSGNNGPIVENLPAGIYYVEAINTLTDCPTDGLTGFTVLDQTVDPNVQIIQNTIDSSCDDDTGVGTRSGTGSITASVPAGSGTYTYTWYEGDGTTTTNLDLAGPGSSVVATGYTILGGSGQTVNNLPDGTYYVEVTDTQNPGEGCVGSETITIQQFNPVISIGAKNVDYIVQDDVNCSSDNGSITLIAVNETQPGGGTIRSTTLANYTFSWWDAPTGGAFLGNGFFFDNAGAGLAADVYYVEVQRTSSECISGSRKAITIQENTSDPLIQLASKTPDDYCVGATANQGSGTLAANINHEGSSTAALAGYSITWYRGSTATAGNELFIIANQGSANDISTANQMSLEGLSTGAYTVAVSKNGTPNDGCNTTSTFSILRDPLTYSLPLSALTINDNLNCANPNGSIVIDGINIDGALSDFATDPDNYTIDWTNLPGGILPSNSVGGKPNDQVLGLEGGVYDVEITNDRTNCTVSASITIDDITSDPLIQLAAKTSDEYCVGATANQGTGTLTANINHEGNSTAALVDYNITWYRGSTATAGNELFIVANQGSANDISTANQMSIEGLSTGTYTVTVSKTGTPNDGCNTTSTFSILRDPLTYSLPLSAITKTNNFNCDNPNGSIVIEGINIDGTFSDFATDPDNYTINWTNLPGGVTPSSTGTKPNDQVLGLEGGVYDVDITNDRTNCTVSASIILNDITSTPLVQLVIRNADEYCSPGLIGNGSLEMKIIHEGFNPADSANYIVDWYRGTGTTTALAGTGSAAISPLGTGLTGLSAGTYTVVVTKNGTPNDQCPTTTTFSIVKDPPAFSIQTTSVQKTDNSNCTNPNGTIEITNVIVDGVVQSMAAFGADYAFTWPDGVNGGSLTSTNGSSNNRATDLPADTYTIIASNVVTGCSTDTIQVTIQDDPTEPTLSFNMDSENTNCGITKNGQLTVTATTADGNPNIGLGRYTFTWYNGQGTSSLIGIIPPGIPDNTSTLSALDSGYYTVTVYDNVNECTTTGTYAVSETLVNPQVLLSDIVVRADSTCDVGSSGTIIVADSSFSVGVLDDYDVEIRRDNPTTGPIVAQSTAGGGNTDLTISSLDPGTFYVTATNAATECPASPARVIILDERFPPAIVLDTLIANPNCGGSITAGSIGITADGFDETNPNYIFQWYAGTIAGGIIVPGGNGGNSATIFNVAEGPYELSVTNLNTGCATTQSFELPSEPVNPRISSYGVSNNLICSTPGSGSFEVNQIRFNGTFLDAGITADSLDIVTNYTFEYYSNATLTTPVVDSDLTTPLQLNGLSAGTYYARVRRNDSDCASGPIEFTLTDIPQFPEIQISQIVADSTCNGLNPNGTLRPLVDGIADEVNYTYDWYEVDPVTEARISGSLSTNDTLSGLAQGRYEVEVTNLLTGCTSTAQRNVTNAPIEVEILAVNTTDPTTCSPTNGIIEVATISPGVLTDYTFDFFLGDPNNGGVNVQTSAGPVYATAEPGSHYIQATHNLYGCTYLYEVDLEDNLIYPEINLIGFENQTNCDPGNPNGELAATADGLTDNTLYTFEWRNASNVIVEPNNSIVTNIPAGTYTLNVRDNNSGCSSTSTFDIIDDFPNPLELVISTTPNSNCIDPNGVMDATIRNLVAIGKPITSYQFYWFNGDQTTGPIPDIANPDYFGTEVTDLIDGDYTVYVVDATDVFCTSEPTLVTIGDNTFAPPFEIEVQNDVTICYDSLPNGRARIAPNSLEVDRDFFEYRYEWFVGTAADTAGQTPFVTGIRADSLDIGTYSVLATDLRTGCENLVSFDIIDDTDAVPPPSVNVISDRDNCIFANGNAVASISGVVAGYRFDWYLATGDTTTVQFTGNQIFTLDSIGYTVQATRLSTGCVSPRVPVTIEGAIVDPVFEVETTSTLCLRTEDGALNQFTGTAEIRFSQFAAIKDIEWIAPDGTIFSNDIKLVNAQPGAWTVRFIADNDCEYTSTFSIQTALKIYNGVSANADGLNDYFFVDCIDYFPNNNVQIFNRDGTKVWEAPRYDNFEVRFEGLSNVGRGGLQLPAGTYFYIIEKGRQEGIEDDNFTDDTNRPRIQGYLELVR